ncbi:DUF2867 domain-containing protein [Aquimarina sp. 2201CG14-23]|uniref:DUF2867 domain-containing protein n=1 Tax=Aquimarina mycalae TaxID=3040073 RepID=UPI00247814A3|nr:DUF2867 domain-containing protein [Aquimarina sp. 2201CG14-23]MDH7447779.1 DUF2867 domain-containing protein [Aquimarina sp. 2201CG14-23]
MKVQKVEIPSVSLLAETKVDYVDSFKSEYTDKEGDVDILSISRAFFSTSPEWIEKLFALRNKIVSIFGLKTGDKVKSRMQLIDNFKGEVGERLGIFKVFDKTENEIILGEDDRHLNFRVSLLLMKQVQEGDKSLFISTTVKFNNWFGRLYFLPVKPFHTLIVPTMLKSVIKEIEK